MSRPARTFRLLHEAPYSWGYVLGAMASDASKPALVHSKTVASRVYAYPQITLTVRDEEFVKAFVDAVAIITGVNYKTRTTLNRSRIFTTVSVCHVPFVTYADSLAPWGCYTWRIPKAVFTNKLMARGFLRGYFDGDGCIGEEKRRLRRRWGRAPRIHFCSTNSEGLSDVQKLLSRVGIASTWRSTTQPYRGEQRPIHFLTVGKKGAVARYWQHIGISLARKRSHFLQAMADYIHDGHWQVRGTKIAIQSSFL